ncbi:hypothetical protein ACFSQT_29325 [Mesorhizobium calcicola]|uniref:Uncharacterized protein n=1 Tax=Mesorhizobium calcicola TaxID=1300310 RepID=A0ABW4WKF6_9HYPH
MMIRHLAAMTDQQAPAAAWQASGPPLVLNTAEKIAQFSSFQPRKTMIASETNDRKA